MRSALFLFAAIVLAVPLRAQHVHQSSPYAGQERREIKALSTEEITQLREGEGMGLALAAELNHYPGPRHALELAGALELSAVQVQNVQQIRNVMSHEAQRLGALIIQRERELDNAFRATKINETLLQTLVDDIARLRGALRVTHLRAHLQVSALLTAEQVRRYDELRGYAR